MNRFNVEQYAGKKVSITLVNNYRYTAVLPEIINDAFTIIDKFGHKVTIDCSMIRLISEWS